MTQHYVSRKIVTAWEQDSPAKVLVCGNTCHKGMDTCTGYCEGKADRPPAAPVVPGYAVKYANGHISWSPKDVFEESHLAVGHVGQFTYDQQLIMADMVEFSARLEALEGVPGELADMERRVLELYINITQKKVDLFGIIEVEVAADDAV